jgi:hypothetical protein
MTDTYRRVNHKWFLAHISHKHYALSLAVGTLLRAYPSRIFSADEIAREVYTSPEGNGDTEWSGSFSRIYDAINDLRTRSGFIDGAKWVSHGHRGYSFEPSKETR